MQLMIESKELAKTFNGKPAVDGLSLSIGVGEIYGLVGSDGAGKTTTIRMLVGALKADSGSCAIGGYNLATRTEAARAQLGYLSQRFSLYEELTVLENIRFFAEVRGMRGGEWLPRCMEILDFVGLTAFKDRRAGHLSGGMRQKLGLASALVARPRVLLLDEPTTGVDPVTRQDFWQLLIALVSAGHGTPDVEAPSTSEGVTVLISTPYMDEAARCHRIGFMRHGRLIAEDAPSQLRSRLAGRILEARGTPLAKMRAMARDDPVVEAVRAFGDRLHIRVAPGESNHVIDRLAHGFGQAGGELDYLRIIPPSLEDVFIFLSEHAYE
jgi:ABC-2 type transport system ATP-binding protein